MNPDLFLEGWRGSGVGGGLGLAGVWGWRGSGVGGGLELEGVWGWRGSGVRDYCLESYNNSQSTGNHKTTKFCFLYLSSG